MSLEQIDGSSDEIALALHNSATARANNRAGGNAPRDKPYLYKTAKTLFGGPHFNEGDYVSVRYLGEYHAHWFRINEIYSAPEYQLTDFVL